MGGLHVAAQARLAAHAHAVALDRGFVDEDKWRGDQVLRAGGAPERCRAVLGPAIRPVDVDGLTAEVLEDEVLGEGVAQDGLPLGVEGVVVAVAGAAEHVEGVAVADGELHELDVVGGLVRVHGRHSRRAARPPSALDCCALAKRD